MQPLGIDLDLEKEEDVQLYELEQSQPSRKRKRQSWETPAEIASNAETRKYGSRGPNKSENPIPKDRETRRRFNLPVLNNPTLYGSKNDETSALLNYVAQEDTRHSKRGTGSHHPFDLSESANALAERSRERREVNEERDVAASQLRKSIGRAGCGEKVLRCHLCKHEKIFTRRDNLSRHISTRPRNPIR